MTHKNGQAYSQDLRDRIFSLVDDGYPVYEVAGLFGISVSCIYRALSRRRTTGETCVAPGGGGISSKLQASETAIRERMTASPDTTIAELRAWLLTEHDVSVSYGATWNTLNRLGLTYKKTAPRGGAGPRRRRRGAGEVAGGARLSAVRQTDLH